MIGGGNMNDHRRTMKTYSLMGFIGGILFMTGDCLIFCYKGYSNLMEEYL